MLHSIAAYDWAHVQFCCTHAKLISAREEWRARALDAEKASKSADDTGMSPEVAALPHTGSTT